ncbi:hypothetical protein ACSBR1_008038 [Camellia fascicularis]
MNSNSHNLSPLQTYHSSGEITLQVWDIIEIHLRNPYGYYRTRGKAYIPNFIGLIGSLRYLNLSYAGFSGIIPH